ncbi:6038_t:CDS:2, partial [Funneliformis caledonium]
YNDGTLEDWFTPSRKGRKTSWVKIRLGPEVPYLSGMLTPCWNGWIGESSIKLHIGKEDFKMSHSAGFLGAK